MQIRYPLLTLFGLALALCLWMVGSSMALTGGELVPPLDDAFIHFQYARRLAEGAPYSYQEGGPLSSGATSLLWTGLLAIGWRLGFQEMRLYIWALGLGVLSLTAAGYASYRWLSRLSDERTGALGALMLMFCGPLLWGAFSGMEVALYAALIAATLFEITRPEREPGRTRARGLVLATLLALVRPEGAVLVGMLAMEQTVEAWLAGGRRARAALRSWPWLIPLSAGTIQPLVNLLTTGMIASTSALAKQNPRAPQPSDLGFFEFVWEKEIWGGFGDYFFGRLAALVLGLFVLGLAGLLIGERQRQRPGIGTVALFWWAVPPLLLAMTLPMTWHHYRYLQPYLVILLPITALGARTVDARIATIRGQAATPFVLVGLVCAVAWSGLGWGRVMGENARDILYQHVDTARWLSRHAPPDAVVAGNDVGALGYLSGRRLTDLEGIVTPSNLASALDGEGAIYERMLLERPDLYVIFPNWFPSLMGAGVLTVRHDARLGMLSISGGDSMVVATLDQSLAATAARPPQMAEGERLLDTVNISELDSESAHGLWLEDQAPLRGRANAIVRARYADGATVVEGARSVFGATGLSLAPATGPARLVMRLGPSSDPSPLYVLCDGKALGVWTLPPVQSGTWQDLSLDLPSGSGAPTQIELIPVEAARPPYGGWQVARIWLVGR